MIRVKFTNVSKSYNLINTGGIKTFLFNFFKQIKEYKNPDFKSRNRDFILTIQL